jgi:hypothetical protein
VTGAIAGLAQQVRFCTWDLCQRYPGDFMAVEFRKRTVSKKSRENLLELLNAELQFVERGGYRRSERSPWRPPYVFEESPSCPNYCDRSRPHLCTDCWLMQFVAPDQRDEQVPCRFVQLTPEGITIDSLYRYGSTAETEQTLSRWLRERIREIEGELADAGDLPLAANS